MSRTSNRAVRAVVIGAVILAASLAGASTRAKSPKPKAGAELVIVANRVVGFVPFSVIVYGRIVNVEPESIEFCRTRVTSITADLHDRPTGHASSRSGRFSTGGRDTHCAAGRLERVPEGYDYSHDLRFDRPGTYQVRLKMVDRAGNRVVSNTIQVWAH